MRRTRSPATIIFGNSVASMATTCCRAVLHRMPTLKLMYAECQIALDSRTCSSGSTTSGTPTGLEQLAVRLPELPSSYYYRQMYACFFKDAVGVQLLDKVGMDNILFETDYPHQDGTWPNSVKAAEGAVGHLDEATIRKIARGNAIKLFDLPLGRSPERSVWGARRGPPHRAAAAPAPRQRRAPLGAATRGERALASARDASSVPSWTSVLATSSACRGRAPARPTRRARWPGRRAGAGRRGARRAVGGLVQLRGRHDLLRQPDLVGPARADPLVGAHQRHPHDFPSGMPLRHQDRLEHRRAIPNVVCGSKNVACSAAMMNSTSPSR